MHNPIYTSGLGPYDAYVEERLPGGSYQVVFISEPDACAEFMEKSMSPNRLVVWSKAWPDCDWGFAPMGWKK